MINKPNGDQLCFYCGQLLRGEKAKTWDHIMPKCKGGSDDPSNLLISCKNCNHEKGALTLEEYRQYWILRLNMRSLKSSRMYRIKTYRFFGERKREEYMQVNIRTASGSVYVIDNVAMTWERIEKTANSGTLRTDSGRLLTVPEIEVGKPCIILGPPIAQDAVGRVVVTTAVKEATFSEPIDHPEINWVEADCDQTAYGTLLHQ